MVAVDMAEAVVGVVATVAVADAKAAVAATVLGVKVVAVVGVKAAATAVGKTVAFAAPTALAPAVVAVGAKAAAVATAVVATTATELKVSRTKKRLPREPFAISIFYSPSRRLRGLPLSSLSYSPLGSKRSSLATTPICHGITR